MKWFANLRLATKVLSGILTLVAVMIGMGMFSLSRMSKISDNIEYIEGNWVPALTACVDLQRYMNLYRVKEYQHIACETAEQMKAAEEEAAEAWKNVEEAKSTLDRLAVNDEERAILKDVETAMAAYLVEHDKIIKLSRDNKKDDADDLITGASRIAIDRVRGANDERTRAQRTGPRSHLEGRRRRLRRFASLDHGVDRR
ncbi:MAG: MCP four helix bundle domain-containing protein [Pirellulales bacterium]